MSTAGTVSTTLRVLLASWKSLFWTDVFFKLLAFAVLAPIVSLLFRGFLAFSDRTVVADTDMLRFLLHPVGWLTLIVVGGGAIGIWALEQAVLMAIGLSADQKQHLTVAAAYRFTLRRASVVFRLSARVLLSCTVLALPFLAVGGGLFLLLLQRHDINYYLDARPPRFWLAAVLIGLDLLVLAAVQLWVLAGWILSLPIVLFEAEAPRSGLKLSSQRTQGRRTAVMFAVATWFIASTLMAAGLTAAVEQLAELLVNRGAGSLYLLLTAVGASLILLSVAQFAASLVSNVWLAALMAGLYVSIGRSKAWELPPSAPNTGRRQVLRMTPFRLFAAVLLAVLAAATVGALAVHQYDLEDRVQITAHRGGAQRAPENTLAAIHQAIADRADYVEIDVQQTRDGVVVVAHDSDLKRVAGASLRIQDSTADELRTIDVGSYFDPRFRDERVPTLAEVLATCRGRINVNIELKYYGPPQHPQPQSEPGLEQRVVELVEQFQMQDSVVVMSLRAEGIRRIQELRPDWTVGLLTAVAVGDLSRVEADFLAVNTNLATPAFIRAAHRRDKQVHVWTVNDSLTISRMISRGADNLITDSPDLVHQVLVERESLSPVERVLLELAFLIKDSS